MQERSTMKGIVEKVCLLLNKLRKCTFVAFLIFIVIAFEGCGYFDAMQIDYENDIDDFQTDDSLYNIEVSTEQESEIQVEDTVDTFHEKEIMFLYDDKIDGYSNYKDFVLGNISAEWLSKEVSWSDNLEYKGNLLYNGISFFIFNTGEEDEDLLGIIMRSGGFCELKFVRNNDGNLEMYTCEITISEGNVPMSIKFYSNGMILCEEEYEYIINDSVSFIGKSITLLKISEGKIDYQNHYSELYDRLDECIRYTYADYINNSETCVIGNVNESGEVDIADRISYEEINRIVSNNIENLSGISYVTLEKWIPTEENGAKKCIWGETPLLVQWENSNS